MNTLIDSHNFNMVKIFRLTCKSTKRIQYNRDFDSEEQKKEDFYGKKPLPLQNNNVCHMPDPQQKVDYPQNFDVKLIISAEIPIEEAKRNISHALSDSHTVHSFVNVRSSGKGNYFSYCFNIDIESKEHLEKTYAALRQIPGLKFAL